jgi:hypothetical protein
VIVHDIKVHNIGTGFEYVLYFFTQAGEVGSENGWSNQVVIGHKTVPG